MRQAGVSMTGLARVYDELFAETQQEPLTAAQHAERCRALSSQAVIGPHCMLESMPIDVPGDPGGVTGHPSCAHCHDRGTVDTGCRYPNGNTILMICPECTTASGRRRTQPQPEFQMVERRGHVFYDHQLRQIANYMHSAGIGFETSYDRARQLLLTHLDTGQQQQFQDEGSFTVRGGVTGNEYHITSSDMFNVFCGCERYCAVLPSGTPKFDSMLAQALTIKCDEERFLRIANKQPALGAYGLLHSIPEVRRAPPALLICDEDVYPCRESAVSFFAIIPEILRIGACVALTIAVCIFLWTSFVKPHRSSSIPVDSKVNFTVSACGPCARPVDRSIVGT